MNDPISAKISFLSFVLFVLSVLPAVADEYAAIREKLELCAGCHGDKGGSDNPEYPILGGQHFYYLYIQLKDFKSGFRKGEIMSPLAADLEKVEMKSMAKYFSEQKWPRIGFNADKAIAAKGEKAAGAGQCVQCHLGGYEGNSRIPRLAGQHPKYLKKTMADFKNKVRTNSPAKSSLMVSYDDADLEAMADFLGDQ
jgi:cytochrome c553